MPTWTFRYVDIVNGSDSNNGTSIALAWKSWNKAITTAHAAGIWVIFRRGQTDTSASVQTGATNRNATRTLPIRFSSVPRAAVSGVYTGDLTNGSRAVVNVATTDGTTYPISIAALECRELTLPDGNVYCVQWVDGANSLQLERPYTGTTAAGAALSVIADPEKTEWDAQCVDASKATWDADPHSRAAFVSTNTGGTNVNLAATNFLELMNLYISSATNVAAIVLYGTPQYGKTQGCSIISTGSPQSCRPVQDNGSYFNRCSIRRSFTGAAGNLIILNHLGGENRGIYKKVWIQSQAGSQNLFSVNTLEANLYSIKLIDCELNTIWNPVSMGITQAAGINAATSKTTFTNCRFGSNVVTNGVYYIGFRHENNFQNINNSGLGQRVIFDCGHYLENVGDAQITPPAGVTSVIEIYMNLSSNSVGYRANASSAYTAAALIDIRKNNTFILRAGTWAFRFPVNTQIASLLNTQLWIELERLDGTLIKSNNAAIPIATGITDWTNYITTDTFTVTATEPVMLNVFSAFYNAASKVFIAPLEWQYNGGQWNRCRQFFVDGDVVWQIDDYPAATDLRTGTTCNQGVITGTCAVPTAGNVLIDVPVDNTVGTFDEAARNIDPTISKVRVDTSYKIRGVNLTGTMPVEIEYVYLTGTTPPDATSLASSVRAKIRRAWKWHLEQIAVENGFNYTIRSVNDPPKSFDMMSEFPSVNIYIGREDCLNATGTAAMIISEGNRAGLYNKCTITMDVVIVDINDMQNAVDKLLSDIQTKFGQKWNVPDPTTGEPTCHECIYAGCEIFGIESNRPMCGISIDFTVWYRQSMTNPSTQI